MRRKYTTQYIADFFAKEGYTLTTSDEFINSHQYFEYTCPAGHSGKVQWHHFKNGGRCSKCKGNAKITQKEAEKHFSDNGCELIDTYVSSQLPLQYKCSCGRISQIRWYDFKAGKRCNGCRPERQSGSAHPRWNPDREKVEITRKLANASHSALKTTFKYLGVKKEARTYLLLGYNGEQLRNWIEKHPNWKNVKDKNWSLDHVFPIKAFVDYGIVDVRLINSLDNLQPMILKENQSKSKAYSKEDFMKWLKGKGYAF